MRLIRSLVACALVVGLSACGPSISAVNARPQKYYQKKLELRGQIMRTQQLPGEVLLEIADARGARILVHATPPLEVATGDWVSAKGLLVPEARVGDQVLYDVLMADRIRRTHPPRLRNLM
jgi:hypothetical protein